MAAWRSIRAPSVLRRIGPWARPSTARSIARATGGRQWHEDDLAALAAHPQDPMAVFLIQVGDADLAGFEDPQPECDRSWSMTHTRYKPTTIDSRRETIEGW